MSEERSSSAAGLKGPALLIYHGLPGSGKSTLAAKEAEAFKASGQAATVVNRDTIRETLFGAEYASSSPTTDKEREVTRLQELLIRNALAKGEVVISDDTNLNPRFLPNLLRLAKEAGAKVGQRYVDVDIEECKRRNKLRGESGGRFVPEHVIDLMARNSYRQDGKALNRIKLNPEKGTAFLIRDKTEGSKHLEERSRKLSEINPITASKKVVLVDVDGTLADNKKEANRAFASSPKKKDFDYFFKSIKFSKENPEVVALANNLREKEDMSIFVLTGRTDANAKDLADFVESTGIKASRIIAKKDGDFRPDYEFKTEVLNSLREEGFELAHSIDDREASVQAYRNLGISVSRVEEHHPEDPVEAPDSYRLPNISTPYRTYLPDSYYLSRGLAIPGRLPEEKENDSGQSVPVSSKAYHLSSDGTVRPCSARTQACPYSDRLHGGSPEEIYSLLEAQEIYEKNYLKSTDLSVSSGRPRKARPLSIEGRKIEGVRIKTLGVRGSYWGIELPNEFVSQAEKSLQGAIGKEAFNKARENKQARDKGKHHVTVVNPANSQKLFKEGKDLGGLMDRDYCLELTGIGMLEDKETGNKTYYATVRSEELDHIADKYQLPKQDYHVTLGFTESDIHGRPKDESTRFIEF